MPRAGFPVVAVLAAAVLWPSVRADRGERVSPRLRAALEQSTAPQLVWVFLRDKGPAGADMAEARARLTPRALARRARRGRAAGGDDAPVFPGYRDEVARHVVAVR